MRAVTAWSLQGAAQPLTAVEQLYELQEAVEPAEIGSFMCFLTLIHPPRPA